MCDLKTPFYVHFSLFLWERKGFTSPTARSFWGSSYERSGLKLDRAMVANVVKLKLSRCDSAYVPHVFKFTFSRCGSRCVKFEVKFTNLAKFDFKFERKKLRRSIFSLDEADLNLRAGATLSVVTE
ncbi:hypothetical protein [Campylobacter rectus]|uniref:hypothetical protein n=2 Tax=Campylobacter rectus TaxID=203 RepID=UPI001639F37B|nr:hypothetical protein [Campylobacter rectus]